MRIPALKSLALLLAALLVACEAPPAGPPLGDGVTITLETPAEGAVLHGRVAAFSGTVSNQSAELRYSVNGGPERGTQAYPPYPGSGSDSAPFQGEAQPLRNGANTIVLRAYLNGIAVGTRSFNVTADVPERRYAVTTVAEVPSGVSVRAHLANDGRMAWSHSGLAYTWHAGTLVTLTGMRDVFALNNVGQVLGRETDGPISVLWKDAVYTRLTDFPEATMLNDHGHLARAMWPGYWHDGKFTAYAQPTPFLSVAAMNNHGAMVGNDLDQRNVIGWLAPPQFQSLPGPPRAYRVSAGAIGDGGHVLVGGRTSSIVPELTNRVAVVHQGSVFDLSATVGLETALANVNESGVVAGTYVRDAAKVPFTWKDGRTTDVVLDSPGWVIEAVTDINDVGQIAGRANNVATGQTAILLLTPLG